MVNPLFKATAQRGQGAGTLCPRKGGLDDVRNLQAADSDCRGACEYGFAGVCGDDPCCMGCN